MTRVDHILGAFSKMQIDIILSHLKNAPMPADNVQSFEQSSAIDFFQIAQDKINK